MILLTLTHPYCGCTRQRINRHIGAELFAVGLLSEASECARDDDDGRASLNNT